MAIDYVRLAVYIYFLHLYTTNMGTRRPVVAYGCAGAALTARSRHSRTLLAFQGSSEYSWIALAMLQATSKAPIVQVQLRVPMDVIVFVFTCTRTSGMRSPSGLQRTCTRCLSDFPSYLDNCC